jgi:hypothetical protein
MSLEKVGRAKVAYELLKKGWKVGEALDDGYDLLAYNPETKRTVFIEVKAMDIDNRSEGVNLTSKISPTEYDTCTHVIIYVEPKGWFFIARKAKIVTHSSSVFAALDRNGELRKPNENKLSFAKYKDCWDELLE